MTLLDNLRVHLAKRLPLREKTTVYSSVYTYFLYQIQCNSFTVA